MNLEAVRSLIEHYYDYSIRILKVEFMPELLKIEFLVEDTDNSEERKFELKVSGAANYYIAKDNDSSNFYIDDDHALLWHYTNSQCSLYVTGNADSFKTLLFELSAIHYTLFEGFLSFDPASALALEKGFGLFQRGSKRLLEIYAKKIEAYGFQTSIVEDYEQYANVIVLFLGNSYFIGESFDFEKLE